MFDFLSTVHRDYGMRKSKSVLFVYENVKYRISSLLSNFFTEFHHIVAENESVKHAHKIGFFRPLRCRTGSTPLKDPCQLVSRFSHKISEMISNHRFYHAGTSPNALTVQKRQKHMVACNIRSKITKSNGICSCQTVDYTGFLWNFNYLTLF